MFFEIFSAKTPCSNGIWWIPIFMRVKLVIGTNVYFAWYTRCSRGAIRFISHQRFWITVMIGRIIVSPVIRSTGVWSCKTYKVIAFFCTFCIALLKCRKTIPWFFTKRQIHWLFFCRFVYSLRIWHNMSVPFLIVSVMMYSRCYHHLQLSNKKKFKHTHTQTTNSYTNLHTYRNIHKHKRTRCSPFWGRDKIKI